MAPRFSKFVFTLNNPTDTHENVLHRASLLPRVRYLCFQMERGESGNLHWQGYVQCRSQVGLLWISKLLGGNAHIEVQRGSNVQARDYARKDDTRVCGPWDYGEFIPGEGARVDLSTAAALVVRRGMHALANELPAMYVRYHRGMRALLAEVAKRRTVMPIVTVIFGPTRVGKTTAVYEDSPDVFSGMYHANGQLWFDGCTGEQDLLFDEFNSEHWPIKMILKVCDKWPCQVPFKGGTVNIGNGCGKVYFVSNTYPQMWWSGVSPELRIAFGRRVTQWLEVDGEGKFIEWTQEEMGFT